MRKVKAAKERSTLAKAPSPQAQKPRKHCEAYTRLKRIGQKGRDCELDPTQDFSEVEFPETILFSTLDDLAIGFFFHYYVLRCTDEREMWRALDSSACLKAAVVALGAAAVTRSGPGLSCSDETQVRYTQAIQLTNQALQSPSDVRKDSTLLAVNLLGVFEVKTGFQRSLNAWHEHVYGAAVRFRTVEGSNSI